MDALTADPDGAAGRYRAVVDGVWNCPVVPQGGIMAALAARAMADEIGDPAQALRTLTTVFAAAVPAGPVTVDVQVLRRGRSVSQALATVRPEGAGEADGGHTTVAAFGRSRPGFAFTDRQPPEVPGPDESPSFGDGYEPGDGEEPFEVPYWQQARGPPLPGPRPLGGLGSPSGPTAPTGTASSSRPGGPTAPSTRWPCSPCATRCRAR